MGKEAKLISTSVRKILLRVSKKQWRSIQIRMLYLYGGMVCKLFDLPFRISTNRISYVWGDNVHKAKTQAERQVCYCIGRHNADHDSLDYIFRLAVEMRNLELPWVLLS